MNSVKLNASELITGITLYCPHCQNGWIPGHFDWASFRCTECLTFVELSEWNTKRATH